jgi:hypothetical protein
MYFYNKTFNTKIVFVYYCRAIENKKIEMAVINMLQLAARKNLIQMSSDVITIVTVIINYSLLKFAITICSF